jgi:hypothetical protein
MKFFQTKEENNRILISEIRLFSEEKIWWDLFEIFIKILCNFFGSYDIFIGDWTREKLSLDYTVDPVYSERVGAAKSVH